MQTVIGIDLGTQQLKVIFYDFERRQIVATENAALDLYRGDGGVAEQQTHWWLSALREAIAKVDADVRWTAVAIGVSGQQHGLVAIDEAGEVLAPVKLWCDTSTGLECQEIMDAFGAMGVELILGGHLHRAFIGNSLDVYPGADRDRGIVIVQSGTTTSSRGRAREGARNSFNVVRVGDERIDVTHFMYFHDLGGFAPLSRHRFARPESRYLAGGPLPLHRAGRVEATESVSSS